MTEQKAAYEALRDAIREFVADHDDPGVAPFKAGIAAWSNVWNPVETQILPAAERFAALDTGDSKLLSLVAEHRSVLRWEQSYTKADGVVGDDMLADYGFVEVIGKWGPFVSDTVRSGVGIYGANITYPPHRHGPEEIYGVLSGGAEFSLEGDPPAWRKPGDIVYVRPNRTHGFTVGPEPMVVFYIWQAGDLREMSTFSEGV